MYLINFFFLLKKNLKIFLFFFKKSFLNKKRRVQLKPPPNSKLGVAETTPMGLGDGLPVWLGGGFGQTYFAIWRWLNYLFGQNGGGWPPLWAK